MKTIKKYLQTINLYIKKYLLSIIYYFKPKVKNKYIQERYQKSIQKYLDRQSRIKKVKEEITNYRQNNKLQTKETDQIELGQLSEEDKEHLNSVLSEDLHCASIEAAKIKMRQKKMLLAIASELISISNDL